MCETLARAVAKVGTDKIAIFSPLPPPSLPSSPTSPSAPPFSLYLPLLLPPSLFPHHSLSGFRSLVCVKHLPEQLPRWARTGSPFYPPPSPSLPPSSLLHLPLPLHHPFLSTPPPPPSITLPTSLTFRVQVVGVCETLARAVAKIGTYRISIFSLPP